jgi:hypothetical protein
MYSLCFEKVMLPLYFNLYTMLRLDHVGMCPVESRPAEGVFSGFLYCILNQKRLHSLPDYYYVTDLILHNV